MIVTHYFKFHRHHQSLEELKSILILNPSLDPLLSSVILSSLLSNTSGLLVIPECRLVSFLNRGLLPLHESLSYRISYDISAIDSKDH